LELQLVVLDRLLKATNKKVVNFLRKKVHPRQNPGYTHAVSKKDVTATLSSRTRRMWCSKRGFGQPRHTLPAKYLSAEYTQTNQPNGVDAVASSEVLRWINVCSAPSSYVGGPRMLLGTARGPVGSF